MSVSQRQITERIRACIVMALLLGVAAPSMAQSLIDPVIRNDADADRIVDTVDVDDDNDGIPDRLEILSSGDDRDSDRDGVPDRLDLDSDNDGILDWQESGSVVSVDFSGLRVVGGRLQGTVGINGMLDALESPVDSSRLRYQLANSDGPADLVPDVLDLDSDNDGLPDLVEAGVAAARDNDQDARIDAPPGTVGRDGIADNVQMINDQTCCDVTGDGVEDVIPLNSDLTDLPDYLDLDSDNDGVFDLVEAGGVDADNDGRVDGFFDVAVAADQPADGLDNGLQRFPLPRPDRNGNGVADHVDPFEAVPPTEPEPLLPTPTVGVPPAAQDNTPLPQPEPSEEQPSSDGVGGTQPLADPANGLVRVGLGGSGCSIQSTSADILLVLLAVLSLTLLSWRFTLRRLRRPG